MARDLFDPSIQGLVLRSAALLAGACALVLLIEERGRLRQIAGVGIVLLLVAVLIGGPPAPIVAALVIGVLALDARDILHGECTVKLLWVLGAALVLSTLGSDLLVAATGTERPVEQWSVLAIGLDARLLWSAALSLSLVFGLVLLGAPPFHFWVADLMQGARAWLGPLALASLQWAGASWLSTRLEGIDAFPAGASVARGLLGVASIAALGAGGLTLLVQRRPERRVGTLASLHGALVVTTFASGKAPDPAWLAGWGVHLLVAITGAATLARFLPVVTTPATPPGTLARHHPATVLVGLLPWFSLAGLPFTPGGAVWLSVGRGLLDAGMGLPFAALVAAWLAALSVCFGQAREAFGLATEAPRVERRVPLSARLVPWAASAALVGLWLAQPLG